MVALLVACHLADYPMDREGVCEAGPLLPVLQSLQGKAFL